MSNNILAILSKIKAETSRSMKWEYNKAIAAFEPEFLISVENEKTLIEMATSAAHLKELQKVWPLYVANPDFPSRSAEQQPRGTLQ
jgi:hypothetical protein